MKHTLFGTLLAAAAASPFVLVTRSRVNGAPNSACPTFKAPTTWPPLTPCSGRPGSRAAPR